MQSSRAAVRVGAARACSAVIRRNSGVLQPSRQWKAPPASSMFWNALPGRSVGCASVSHARVGGVSDWRRFYGASGGNVIPSLTVDVFDDDSDARTAEIIRKIQSGERLLLTDVFSSRVVFDADTERGRGAGGSHAHRVYNVHDTAYAPASAATTVYVGMSGGVDSAVTALLLTRMGYSVHAVFMDNWDYADEDSDDVKVCTADDEFADVERACRRINRGAENTVASASASDASDGSDGISSAIDGGGGSIGALTCERVDFKRRYWTDVFEDFLDGFQHGDTRNPDVLCNRYIKFDAFLAFARERGADFIATGHYARLLSNDVLGLVGGGGGGDGGVEPAPAVQLCTAYDAWKDQTYFLSQTKRALLAHVMFPLGDLTKRQVRRIAAAAGLHIAAKKDSNGICFIGERNFPAFIRTYVDSTPGDFVTRDGAVVGRHSGMCCYTIGQGAKIAGGTTKYFVARKNLADNTITVVADTCDPLLMSDSCVIDLAEVSLPRALWQDIIAHKRPLAYKARHTEKFRECTVELEGAGGERRGDEASGSQAAGAWQHHVRVHFGTPHRAITPGQVLVLYYGNVCIGGGRILRERQ